MTLLLVGLHFRNTAKVSVFESLAVAFECDDFGVVDESDQVGLESSGVVGFSETGDPL